jgi:uncharacterized metal-binding protein YceD (DUF177 family)
MNQTIQHLKKYYIGRQLFGLVITGIFYDKNIIDAYYFTYEFDYTHMWPVSRCLKQLEVHVMNYYNVKIWYYHDGGWANQTAVRTYHLLKTAMIEANEHRRERERFNTED